MIQTLPQPKTTTNSLVKVVAVSPLGLVAVWFGVFELGFSKIMSGKQDGLIFGIIIWFYYPHRYDWPDPARETCLVRGIRGLNKSWSLLNF